MGAEISRNDVLDAVEKMSVMDIVQLVKDMEERFNVSAAVAVAAAPAGGGASAEAAVEEQTAFTVMMTSFGDQKINVIKEVRAVTSLDLKAAKDLVEGVPSSVKENLSKQEAEALKKRLEDAGATAEIK